MPPIFYPMIAAVVWASSAAIINKGLSHCGEDRSKGVIAIDLMTALGVGVLCLLPFAWPIPTSLWSNRWLWLAGVLTFPIGTGLYYLSSQAFGKRAELAAQLSQVKPIISVGLAGVVLHEAIGIEVFAACGFTLGGIVIFIRSRQEAGFDVQALGLGLLLALAWALGEISIKLGETTQIGLKQTFVSLCAGATFWIPIACVALLRSRNRNRWSQRYYWFGMHGILSFGVGYVAFFEGIRTLGVARSALIVSFWPILALALKHLSGDMTPKERARSKGIWAAALLLLLGSFIAILARN